MGTIQAVKGTRDFYPEDLAFRRWLYERIREVSEGYGYEEYDGPFLERLDLYAARSGEELVRKQSFVFPDRGGEMIALRPELTPSLARMVAMRSKSLPRPLRWWSFGPFWRYERPQQGRAREFFQWNIDLLGVDSPEADAEIAAIAGALFMAVGLGPDKVQILVNDRRLAERQLSHMGIDPEKRMGVFHLIDGRDRVSKPAWERQAAELGLEAQTVKALDSTLNDREAWKDSPELTAFFAATEALGVAGSVFYDPSIVRGLDYYTGIVFEARDTSGEFRAILGGGRYDNLVSGVGGEPIPATGFAMGDMVIHLLMEKTGVSPAVRSKPTQVLVPSFDVESMTEALSLSAELRACGLRAEWYPTPVRLSTQLKYADRHGIPLAAIIGPDEISSSSVTIKDLRTGAQENVPRSQAGPRLVEIVSEAGK
jgi:histidyl-tRNA synthetase